VGFGSGRHLLHQAINNPDILFIGIEIHFPSIEQVLKQITIKNLHVVSVDSEKNEVLISGAIPGRIGSFLTIKKVKSGSLKDLEHEVVAQVVEVEAPVKEIKEEVKNES